MKHLIIILLFLSLTVLNAQGIESFEGSWEGELMAYDGSSSRKITTMQLIITPADSYGTWNYKMIYGDDDIRNYKLKAVNRDKNKYIVDEGDGIILYQDMFCSKFISCFETGNSLLVITLEKRKTSLLFEVNAMSVKDKKKSGKGDKDTPFVYSYPVTGFQRAVLTKK